MVTALRPFVTNGEGIATLTSCGKYLSNMEMVPIQWLGHIRPRGVVSLHYELSFYQAASLRDLSSRIAVTLVSSGVSVGTATTPY